MTNKQKILLFLISCDPGIRDIYKMVKVYHRASLTFEITENLQLLLDNNLIIVSKYFDNNTSNEYQITEKGNEFLVHNFNDDEAIQFIKTLDDPDLLLMITQAYIDKKNGR
jgi:predicted transcriptional regulator